MMKSFACYAASYVTLNGLVHLHPKTKVLSRFNVIPNLCGLISSVEYIRDISDEF